MGGAAEQARIAGGLFYLRHGSFALIRVAVSALILKTRLHISRWVFAYLNLVFGLWKSFEYAYCGQKSSLLAGASGGKPTSEFPRCM